MCKSSQTPPSMLFGHHSYYLHIHQITSSFTSTQCFICYCCVGCYFVCSVVCLLCVVAGAVCCIKVWTTFSECLPWIVVMRQTNWGVDSPMFVKPNTTSCSHINVCACCCMDNLYNLELCSKKLCTAKINQ